MQITVLSDQPQVSGMVPEFGLSLLLQTQGKRILFDTGAGDALLPNLKRLGIDPAQLEMVVLSHGHSDHTGGLAGLSPRTIWCGKGGTEGHFSRHGDGYIHPISMPEHSREVLMSVPHLCEVDGEAELLPGVLLLGPVPRESGEDCGGDFYHDAECRICDTIPEELFLLTSGGVLVTGCCHAGILNSLALCRKLHPELPVRAIAGGLHLRHASPERLERTAAGLKAAGVRNLWLLHCTGEEAVAFLRRALPECQITSPLPGETFSCEG